MLRHSEFRIILVKMHIITKRWNTLTNWVPLFDYSKVLVAMCFINTGWASLTWKSKIWNAPKSAEFWSLTWFHMWKILHVSSYDRSQSKCRCTKNDIKLPLGYMSKVYMKHRWILCLDLDPVLKTLSTYKYTNIWKFWNLKCFWLQAFQIRITQPAQANNWPNNYYITVGLRGI